MNALEIAALSASIVAIGIGLLAIWLSVVFYRMTTELSESTKEAAKDISAIVERLEKLFNTLYADTFSMMRETVTDMRRHMWPEKTGTEDKVAEEAGKRADEKVGVLKNEIDIEIAQLLHKQSKTDAKIESLKDELQRLIGRAITESRKVEVEARGETIREHIVSELLLLPQDKPRVSADLLVDRMKEKFSEFPLPTILNELKKMKGEGIILWEGERLQPTTIIELKR